MFSTKLLTYVKIRCPVLWGWKNSKSLLSKVEVPKSAPPIKYPIEENTIPINIIRGKRHFREFYFPKEILTLGTNFLREIKLMPEMSFPGYVLGIIFFLNWLLYWRIYALNNIRIEYVNFREEEFGILSPWKLIPLSVYLC